MYPTNHSLSDSDWLKWYDTFAKWAFWVWGWQEKGTQKPTGVRKQRKRVLACVAHLEILTWVT